MNSRDGAVGRVAAVTGACRQHTDTRSNAEGCADPIIAVNPRRYRRLDAPATGSMSAAGRLGREVRSHAGEKSPDMVRGRAPAKPPNGLAGLARRQGEQGGLRAAGEPGRGPRRRAKTGGNVQPGRPVGGMPVNAADTLTLDH